MLLHYSEVGSGSVIVFIHGMAGSGRYWNDLVPFIQPSHRTITLDLLGFGQSPKPKDVVYDYDEHLRSILETLVHLNVTEPFTLVGHSMGGLLALRLSALYPHLIHKLVLIAVPVYTTPAEAHHAIAPNKLKEWAYYGWSSRLLCTTWCYYLRPISSKLAPLYLPKLTKAAAQDSVYHTWQAYAQSLHYVIEKQQVGNDLEQVKNIPIILVYGDKDLPSAIKRISLKGNIKLVIIPGTHQITYEMPGEITRLILSKT